MTDDAAIVRRLALLRLKIAGACRAAGRGAGTVELLAVSKQQPAAAVRAAHAAGQRAFGENRVQELVAKAGELADLPGLCWHMIGSLQTNKVRDLVRVPGLVLLHSLDRVRLADELQRELERAGRRLDVLLELHATGEPSKHGCAPGDAPALLEHVQAHCPALAVTGVMAMGPQAGDPAPVFRAVAAQAADLRRRSGLPLPTLSLGMSNDLEAAVAAGSTLVRIGSAVFGPRG
ncbi:MAG: YggS family pyridoxal phosphate-dependent enzyme [Planctomycetes bacterium]|nr:YggS family pyridoxal phosphate-dependent enzyme [Planctomycetota bacterium]